MGSPWGTYAEYCLAPASTTIRLPPTMSYEDAATIPLVAFTAAQTMWRRQQFPAPWTKAAPDQLKRQPLVVYGAGSALGSFLLQFAKTTPETIGPIVAIGGASGRERLAEILDLEGEDVLLDYRKGSEVWVAEAKEALRATGGKALHVVDCISNEATYRPLVELVGRGGRLSVTSGSLKVDQAAIEAEGGRTVYTYVGTVHDGVYYKGAPFVPESAEVEGEIEWAGLCAVCGAFNPCCVVDDDESADAGAVAISGCRESPATSFFGVF